MPPSANKVRYTILAPAEGKMKSQIYHEANGAKALGSPSAQVPSKALY